MILAIRCKNYNQVETFLKQVRATYEDLDVSWKEDIFIQEVEDLEKQYITPLPEDQLEYRVLVTLYYGSRL